MGHVRDVSRALHARTGDGVLLMTRRAYGFAAGLALAFGLLAWAASYRVDLPLRDPDGLAGPSYIRLPLIVLLFYLADVVPRVFINNRGFKNFGSSFKKYSKQRWTRSRVTLVLVGLSSFYVVYVAYRNLKSFLPFIRDTRYDPLLEDLDKALMFGHYPATVLHEMLGMGISAHVLSFVYTGFLMFVPVSLGAALVWSKNVSTGFWYVTALCLNWVLGVASYYWLPSLGPAFAKPSLFNELPDTGVTALQDALSAGRSRVLNDPFGTQTVQSVAAFASLHVSIIFTAALICHYVIPNKWVRWTMWVYFVLTSIATIYFGWHYLLDDVAGLAIGWIAVWIGAKATGHPMRVQRHVALEDDGVIGVFPPGSSGRNDREVDPALVGTGSGSEAKTLRRRREAEAKESDRRTTPDVEQQDGTHDRGSASPASDKPPT